MADSKIIDDGGYAFPCPADEKAGWHSESGMTMRDWFAGKFLSGVAGSPESAAPLEADPADQLDVDRALREHWDFAARAAYIAADAMIAARKAGA